MSKKPWQAKPRDPNEPSAYEKHQAALAGVFQRGLEDKTLVYVKPWKVDELADLPHNPTTGKPYTRSNEALLGSVQAQLVEEGKCTDPGDNRWATYAQWTSVGGQVRKGEKQTVGISKHFSKAKDGVEKKEDQKPGDEPAQPSESDKEKSDKPKFSISSFGLFHASQVDGIAPRAKPSERPLDERIQSVLDLVEQSGATVEHGGNKAYYHPARDVIRMPERAAFDDDMKYARVLLHELGHWSGAKGRLDRPFSFDREGPEYAREEMRVEVFSYMSAQRLGLDFNPEDGQHQAYVAQWAKNVKDDPAEITKAVRDASNICDYLKVPSPTYEILPEVVRDQTKEKANTLKGPKPPPNKDGLGPRATHSPSMPVPGRTR